MAHTQSLNHLGNITDSDILQIKLSHSHTLTQTAWLQVQLGIHSHATQRPVLSDMYLGVQVHIAPSKLNALVALQLNANKSTLSGQCTEK